jgi:hypothetical protein
MLMVKAPCDDGDGDGVTVYNTRADVTARCDC